MPQWNKSILLGCACIAACIVIAGSIIGHTIADNLYAAAANIPGSFTTYNGGTADTASGPYLSPFEAAIYCRIDYVVFEKAMNQGKLDGAYIEYPMDKAVVDEEAYAEILRDLPEGAPSPEPPVTIVPGGGVERVFVKEKLDEWMLAQIAP